MATESTGEGVVGSLLETLAQDTHLEHDPQIQPDTSGNSKLHRDVPADI